MATLIFLAMSFWFWYQDNRAENLEKMRPFYQKHDLKRTHLIISILNKYEISITDTEALESLIGEAKKERNEIFLVRLLSNNMSMVTGLASIAYRLYFDLFLKCAMNDISGIDAEYIFSVLFTCFIAIAIAYFIKEPIIFICLYFFSFDYYDYEALIYDLRQVKIFRKSASDIAAIIS